MAPADWILLSLATVFAASVQAATGFGFAVLAVPLFLLILNSVTAVQLVIAVTLAISLVLLPRLWDKAPRRVLRGLIVGTLIGFPFGMVAFLFASVFLIKAAVGGLIVAFAALLLARNLMARIEGYAPEVHPTADLVVGVISGAMTTALGMPGPVVVIYLSWVGMAKDTFRATTLCLFAVSYGGALVLQAAVAGIDGETWLTAAVLAPMAALGAGIGHVASRWLSPEVFRTAVLVILVVTGISLLATTLAAR